MTESEPNTGPDSEPARVLIVDDDEAHAETLADALEIDGYRCRIANSGRAGVAALREESFEVVLTDLVMHDLSGLEQPGHFVRKILVSCRRQRYHDQLGAFDRRCKIRSQVFDCYVPGAVTVFDVQTAGNGRARR